MYKKIYSLLIFLSLAGLGYAGLVYNPMLSSNFDMIQTIEEEDGSPSVPIATTIKVTNGSLTDNADGTVSLATGAGGGGGDLLADGSIPLTADWNAGNSLYDITAVEFKGALKGNADTVTNGVYTGDFPLNQDTTGSSASCTGESATVATITGLAPDTQNTYARTQYLIPYASTTTAFGEIAIGDATQVLTSNGAGSAPTFQAAAAGSGDLKADGSVPLTADWNAGNSLYDITAVEFKGALKGNADTVTNATLTTAITVDTGTVGLTGAGANTSVLTLAAGASSIEGTNSGDNTVCTSGAATTAETLKTARAINGVDFNGSQAITVTAAAGTLTGATLKSDVLASSLTSVGTITSLVATTADINAGTVDAVIGGTTPAAGAFTTITATGGTSTDWNNAATLGACDGINTVYDVDGNRYGTVVIGGQCWMSENMRTTQYPDKTAITKGCIAEDCGDWDTDTTQYSCPPNVGNTAEDCNAAYRYGENSGTGTGEALGMFYQWSAAMNGSTDELAQGICPEGWHIPTNGEWEILEEYLGSADCRTDVGWQCTPAGNKMKTPDKCSVAGDSNCSISGFNGLLTGDRYTNSNYCNRGTYTHLWSSTVGTTGAWTRYLSSTESNVYRGDYNKAYGFSVRCLKD